MRQTTGAIVAALIGAVLVVTCGAPAQIGVPQASPREPAVWPLRGTSAPDHDAIRKRPVVVRVANDRPDRPQAGLAQADLVFEILVEGGLTRFAVVYQSNDADSIGPVRSARLSDLHYTPMLRGILAHVGAQAEVLRRIRESAERGRFVDVDQFQHAEAYDRVGSRPAPHNVYTSTQRLREAAAKAGDRTGVDVPALQFEPGTPSEKLSRDGKPQAQFAITYPGGRKVGYEHTGSVYRRTEDGQTTVDEAAKKDVEITNVVVIKTDITETAELEEDVLGSKSLEIRTTGTGPVTVFMAGQRFEGTWSRQGDEMYRFADGAGAVIALKPGLTWIHVVKQEFEITE